MFGNLYELYFEQHIFNVYLDKLHIFLFVFYFSAIFFGSDWVYL